MSGCREANELLVGSDSFERMSVGVDFKRHVQREMS